MSSATKNERTPLLLPPTNAPATKSQVSPLPSHAAAQGGFSSTDSGNDNDAINLSGSSVRSRAASDPVTFDAMMQLSAPHNVLRTANARACVLWLTSSSILVLTNQLTTLSVGFFPTYAQRTFGMTPAQLSLFFALYPLCIMLSSPLAARVSPLVGRQTVVCVGLVLSGTTTLAFAYAQSIATLFVLRVLQGIGAGAAVVGAFAMLVDEFTPTIGRVFAVQELLVAAAFVTAPPLGSVLFELGGYALPFVASGVAQLVVVMVVPFLFIEYSLPDGLYARNGARLYYNSLTPSQDAHERVAFASVLTPTCVVCLVSTVFAMAAFGFIDPHLGSHLQRVLGAQHIAIGCGFALSALVYFVGGVAYVWLSHVFSCKPVILAGLAQLAIGFALLGPPPFIDALVADATTLWTLQSLALVAIGCGAALAIAPGLPLTLQSVDDSGPQARNLVVGLFSAAIYLGQALGPLIALLLLAVLPTTHARSCFASEAQAFATCESALPHAFTAYAVAAVALVAFVAWRLPSADAVAAVQLQDARRRFSLARQTSMYGQFVDLDEDDCTESDSV